MSLEFLAGIVEARFPLTVRHPIEVDKVRLLKAAELITASVPPEWISADHNPSAAVVFGVTERGELAARQAAPPPEAPLRRRRIRLDDD